MSHAGIQDREHVIEDGWLVGLNGSAVRHVRNLSPFSNVKRCPFRNHKRACYLGFPFDVDGFRVDGQVAFHHAIEAHILACDQATVIAARNIEILRRGIQAVRFHIAAKRDILRSNGDVVRYLRMIDHDVLRSSTHAIGHRDVLERHTLTCGKNAAMPRSANVDLVRIERLTSPIEVIFNIGVRNRMHEREHVARVAFRSR